MDDLKSINLSDFTKGRISADRKPSKIEESMGFTSSKHYRLFFTTNEDRVLDIDQAKGSGAKKLARMGETISEFCQKPFLYEPEAG